MVLFHFKCFGADFLKFNIIFFTSSTVFTKFSPQIGAVVEKGTVKVLDWVTFIIFPYRNSFKEDFNEDYTKNHKLQ